jgi:hypothetical protein
MMRGMGRALVCPAYSAEAACLANVAGKMMAPFTDTVLTVQRPSSGAAPRSLTCRKAWEPNIDDCRAIAERQAEHLKRVGWSESFEEGKGTVRLSQDVAHAIAILNVGGMDDDAQQEAERINEDVPLAARDLLARIIALQVERGAPF